MELIKNKKSWGTIFLFTLISLFSYTASAQEYTKDEKKISKCWKVFEQKSMMKGIEKLEKYMSKQDQPSLTAYESLVAMEHQWYLTMANFISMTTITSSSSSTSDESLSDKSQPDNSKDEDSEENVAVDSLVNDLMTQLGLMYRNRFVDVCRRSTMESMSPSADMYLRQMLVDEDPDSLVDEEAIEFFGEAEEFFRNEEYNLAAISYRKALDVDSSYYKAMLYLGDSFWAREQYDSAIVYYDIAKEMQPQLLEPRLYLIDAFTSNELYYRAKKECVEAMMIYPGYNLKLKYQVVLSTEDKYMNERRLLRRFYPNNISVEDQGLTKNTHPVWYDYRAAKEDISKYCNEDGIIEDNGETKDRYLEVYCFRNMLKSNSGRLPENLEFAKQMMDEGFLEPYVFISLFHIDIYPQFKDYMKSEENREKSKEFIEEYLIEMY